MNKTAVIPAPGNDAVKAKTCREIEIDQCRRDLEAHIREQLCNMQQVRIYGCGSPYVIGPGAMLETMKEIDFKRLSLAIALSGTSHSHWGGELLHEIRNKAADALISEHVEAIYHQASKEVPHVA